MNQDHSEITEFRAALAYWFKQNGRRLPWRETWDPYSILVSELMLQQTQVSSVIGHYRDWFTRFPTLRDLAHADESDVLLAWEGLGYYARARNLHKSAKILVERKNAIFPTTVDELLKLPGVGRYTAGAIASFAFDLPAPVVDANVQRVVSRVLNIRQPIDEPGVARKIWDFADQYARGPNPRILNSALMELGATVCLARRPLCSLCPVRTFCAADNPAELPVKKQRQKFERRTEAHILALRGGYILLQQSPGRRWHSLWILPALQPELRFHHPVAVSCPLVTLSYSITRYIVRLNIYPVEPPAALEAGEAWHHLDSVACLPMPSPHRRAMSAALALNGERNS
ncbi:MAG TPA: A/G-specific adenine glycosylase [Chthoniobacterales bacterium]|jgi:A/G-specific adenine glycosylase|nr:A/G-specific adenine glycosylase [Chthoniobacterales bacterium]